MSAPTPATIRHIMIESGSTSSSRLTSKRPAESHVHATESSVRSSASRPVGEEHDDRGTRGDRDGQGGEVAGGAPREPRAGDRDQQQAGERREQADPGGGGHQPRSRLSRSTSSSRPLRDMATMRPRPTTTSEAATAMTVSAKIWPA